MRLSFYFLVAFTTGTFAVPRAADPLTSLRLAHSTQLTDADIKAFPPIAFSSTSTAQKRTTTAAAQCKTFPGDATWPSPQEWARLNITLNGALLRPRPAASVCYPTSPEFNAERCNWLLTNATSTTFYFDDPLTILTQWPQGNTCPASRNPTGNCTQGGFPEYVVNATTVKHVQAAVNFARNKNIRLVIKNTGHDFVGRNVGAGSLSVWTHHLKGFEFYPDFQQPAGNYRGPAAWVGAGLHIWEAFEQAARYNVTLPAGSCLTVGAYGGWMAGGGHSPLSSKFGLGVDQALVLKVVTADGRYVTASPEENQDLFFALRGGGGSTFGIVTSAIVKAHPQINLTIASFSFSVDPLATPTPPGPDVTIANLTAWWAGFNAVFAFGIPTVDAGGYLWTNAIPLGNSRFLFQTRVQLPGMTVPQASSFVSPLISTLNTLGIPVAIDPPTTEIYSRQTGSHGGGPGNGYFASRLFPRAAYEDPTLFTQTMSAVRAAVEAGYFFHGLNMAPTLTVAGHPYPAGVNPVWRTAVMHADLFATVNMATATPAQEAAAYARFNGFMDGIRAATPGGGAYLNEADPREPNWQESFYGGNYARLVRIKRERDPWQVFWAPTTPGSEAWAVRTPNEIPSQNGRLCRVG